MNRKDKRLGKHVRVSKDDYRPYVLVSDLAQRKEFQEAIEYSKKNKEKLFGASQLRDLGG